MGCKWGDYISLEYGKPVSDKKGKDGCVPVFGTNGKIGNSHLSPLCPFPSVIIGRKGAYRGVHYSNVPFSVIDTAFYVKPKTVTLDLKWVYYKFKTYNINAMDSGSAIPSTDRYELYNLPIKLPSLPTQQKIAKILSSLDDKIELNNRMNENLEAQAQSVFKSWFVDFEPFGGVMPEGWEIKALAELTDTVTKGTTPTTLGKRFQENGVNFIKAESILDTHAFDLAKFAYIDEDTNKLLKRSIINSGDILFTIAGTLGRFALVGSDIIPANTNQAVAIIRADKRQVSPEYIYSFFLGDWHNNYYSKRVQQAVQANLSLTTIKSLPIIVATKADTQAYENLLVPLLHRIRANQQENQKLAQLRDTLLPRLMSGEIDVDGLEV